MTCNGGGDFYSLGAYFQFDGYLPKIMFGHLPPVIHIPEHMEQAAILRWSLERFSAEFRGDKMGRTLIMNHLAPIMLLQILRIYLASAKNEKNMVMSAMVNSCGEMLCDESHFVICDLNASAIKHTGAAK